MRVLKYFYVYFCFCMTFCLVWMTAGRGSLLRNIAITFQIFRLHNLYFVALKPNECVKYRKHVNTVCCVLSVWCVFFRRGVASRRWLMRRALCHPDPSQLPHYQSFRMYCYSSSILRPPHWVSLFFFCISCGSDSRDKRDLILKKPYIPLSLPLISLPSTYLL